MLTVVWRFSRVVFFPGTCSWINVTSESSSSGSSNLSLHRYYYQTEYYSSLKKGAVVLCKASCRINFCTKSSYIVFLWDCIEDRTIRDNAQVCETTQTQTHVTWYCILCCRRHFCQTIKWFQAPSGIRKQKPVLTIFTCLSPLSNWQIAPPEE